jgi:large subunit ribosomal protein L30
MIETTNEIQNSEKIAKREENKSQKKIQVVQIGSSIRRDKRQALYLKSLGLGKIGKKKELVDSNSVRSLISKVLHMVKIVE